MNICCCSLYDFNFFLYKKEKKVVRFFSYIIPEIKNWVSDYKKFFNVENKHKSLFYIFNDMMKSYLKRNNNKKKKQ